MPVGGKLVLKGGHQVTASGVTKKKKKKSKGGEGDAEKDKTGKSDVPKPKSYEEEFALEMSKAKQGKAKNTPWGSGYRAAPEVLHGYTTKVKGKTAEERLDMRAAVKADKFCK